MAALLCVTAAGCGTQKGNESTASTATNKESGAVQDNAGSDPSTWPVVATEIPSRNNMDDVPMVQEALNKHLAEIDAGVQIELVPVEIGNISTTMTLMLTSGDDPIDLFNWRWYSNLVNVVRNEQVIGLNKYKDQYPELWQLADENVLKSHVVNGETYGFPTMDGFCTAGWYALRKDIAEELGMADKEGEALSLEELTDLMKRAKQAHPEYAYVIEPENGSNLMRIDNLGNDHYIGVLLHNGVDQDTIVNYFDTQEFEDFCRMTRDWAESGLFIDDPLNQEISLSMYSNGVSAGFLAGSYSVANLKASTTYLTDEYVAFQVSELAGMGSSIGGGWCISSVSKNPDAAMKMLYLLETDEYMMNTIALGIEGVHYVLDENGCAWYPEGINAENVTYNNSADWFYPNRYLTHPFQNPDPNYFVDMKEVSKNAEWSNAMGFAFDSQNVYDQYTACYAVVDEYYKALKFGQVDVDTYLPKFREELKNAGIDEVIAEMQKQFDTFLGK